MSGKAISREVLGGVQFRIFACALARLCTPDAGNYPWALFAVGWALLLPAFVGDT